MSQHSLHDSAMSQQSSHVQLNPGAPAQKLMVKYGAYEMSFSLHSTTALSSVTGECKKKYHHWCLDNTSLSLAGVRGIIAGGVLFIVIAACVSFFVYKRRKSE